MRRLKIYLENAILINFCIFLLLSPYSRRLVKVCFCIGIIGWLLLNILEYKKRFYHKFIPANPLNKPILFFLTASIISIIFSSNPYHSQSTFFERYIPFTLLFWMAIGLTDKVSNIPKKNTSNLHVLISSFLISGIIFGLGAVRDYFLFHPYRLFTVFGREIPFHMLALYLVYFIPFSFVLLAFSKKIPRYLGLISLILLIPCWVWQGSRAAWSAVMLSLLIISIIAPKNKKLTLFLFLILILVFFVFSFRQFPERIKRFPTPSDRFAIMEVAVKIFQDFPFFGAGLGMYEELFSKYWRPPAGYQAFSYLHAHNTYLEVLSEMGIVGLLTFLWIFAVFFKNIFKTIRNISSDKQVILLGLTGSLIATLIFAFFCSIILVGVEISALFWFLFGIASGLLKTKEVT